MCELGHIYIYRDSSSESSDRDDPAVAPGSLPLQQTQSDQEIVDGMCALAVLAYRPDMNTARLIRPGR
jgi:hypothetical protein